VLAEYACKLNSYAGGPAVLDEAVLKCALSGTKGLAKISGFIAECSGVGMEGSSDGHAPILLSCS
jgi:hypothetical protein